MEGGRTIDGDGEGLYHGTEVEGLGREFEPGREVVLDQNTQNRRGFLRRTAAMATVARLGGQIVKAEEEDPNPKGDMLPIIDTHQHLWDLRVFRLPWIKEGAPLARNFLLSDYAEATEGLNVVKTIYMEVDVEPAQHVAEAEMVIRTCREKGSRMVGGVIGGRPASSEFRDYVARFKGVAEIKGVRQVLHGPQTPAGYCLQDDFKRGVRLLGENGLTFDLCVRPAELRDAAKLIDACPDTAFILDHCGNANVQEKDRSQWQDDLAEVARRKNVVCKVSGIVASAKPGAWTADDLKPIVDHVLDSFGPDRVMFGGDWPVCTLAATFREWVDALKAIVAPRNVANQRKLFHDNAVRVYRLS